MIVKERNRELSLMAVTGFIFVLIFSFSINKVIADPGTYYVNISTGSNANSGSQSAPFKSITYALTQVNAGDTISVAAGVYNSSNGETFPLTINKNNITLQGAGRDSTIIRINENERIIVLDGVDGVSISDFNFDDMSLDRQAISLENESSNILVTNNSFTSTTGNALATNEGGSNITFSYNIVSGVNFGVVVNSVAASFFTINNNIFFNTDTDCLYLVDISGSTIINNTFYGCGVGGASGSGLTIVLNSSYTGNVVKNNIIYNTNGSDIHTQGEQDIKFSYNLVSSFDKITGSAYHGVGDFTGDPLFTDPDNGDFTLRETSPAIDAGDPSSECASEPEASDCIIDLGAYGNTSSATVGAAISEIYVDASSGDDSTGDGSATKPYKTLNRALGRVRYQDGDTIYASGTFTEQVYLPVQRSGKKGSPTTISLWPEDFTSATIDATNQDYGFYIWGASYVTLDEVLVVQNASQDGIYVKDSDNITINGAEISNNSGNGALFESSDNIMVTNSEIADNAVAGIHFVSSSGATVTGNWLSNNALALEQNSPNATLTNNFIFNSASPGIYVSDSYPVTIKNNTIYNIEYSSVRINGSESAPEVNIINNIIYVPAGDYYALEIGENITETTNLNFDYNNYYFAGEGSKLHSITNGETLANWQENYSLDLNSISADPLFEDAENFDFHLQETSPSIDAGDPSDDYSNEPEPNGNRIDQGGYGNTSGATSGVNAKDVGDEDDVDNDSITDDDDNIIYEKEDETDRFETKSLSAKNTWINEVNVADESARFIVVEDEDKEDEMLFANDLNILGKKAKGIKKVYVRIKHKGEGLDKANVKVQKRKWQHTVSDNLLEKGEEYKVQAKDAASEGEFTKLAEAIQTNPAPTMINFSEPVIVVPESRDLEFTGLVHPNLDGATFTLKNSADVNKVYKCSAILQNSGTGTQSVFCSFGQNVPVGEYNLGFQSIENYNGSSLPSVAQKKLLFVSNSGDVGGVLNTDRRNTLFNSRITTANKVKLVGIGPQNSVVKVYLVNIEGSDFYTDRLKNLQLLAEGEYVSAIGWQAEISLASLSREKTYLLIIDFFDTQTEKLRLEDRILYPIFFSQKVVPSVNTSVSTPQDVQSDEVEDTETIDEVKEENKIQDKSNTNLKNKLVLDKPNPTVSVQREVRDGATDKILQTIDLPQEQKPILKVITIKGFPEISWLPWRKEKSVDIITFSGTTIPNAEVILTIRSEPIVRITRADKEGKWTISVRADDLPEGEHIAYLQTGLGGVRSEEIEIAKFVVVHEERLSNTSIVFIVNAALIALILIFIGFYQMRRKMLSVAETPLKEEPLSSVKPIYTGNEKDEKEDKSPPSPPPQQGVFDI